MIILFGKTSRAASVDFQKALVWWKFRLEKLEGERLANLDTTMPLVKRYK